MPVKNVVGSHQVNRGDDNGDEHDGEPHYEELPEADLVAGSSGNCRGELVGAGSQEGSVGPVAGAQTGGPDHRKQLYIHMMLVGHIDAELHHYGGHRGIVDDGGEQGRKHPDKSQLMTQ